MSTYIMSDIHGQLAAFNKMLTSINFNIQQDKLYTLGDYVDWGPESIKLVQQLMKMSEHENVTCLMGNHDKMMLDIVRDIPIEASINDIQKYVRADKLELWLINNGYNTLVSYMELNKQDRDAIRLWLEHLRYFIPDIEVNDRQFYVCHSSPYLKGMSFDDIIWKRMKKDRISNQFIQKFPNTTIISGHTITKYFDSYDGTNKCKIFSSDIIPYINIDCGAKCIGRNAYGRLGCLRIEDMAEFYVD